mgnify:CR=1 FL=1
MRAKEPHEIYAPAKITPGEVAWCKRVKRPEKHLQSAHFSLMVAGMDSNPISRSVRAVKLTGTI